MYIILHIAEYITVVQACEHNINTQYVMAQAVEFCTACPHWCTPWAHSDVELPGMAIVLEMLMPTHHVTYGASQDLDAWELERLLSGKFDNAGCQVATVYIPHLITLSCTVSTQYRVLSTLYRTCTTIIRSWLSTADV
jgi:hypothetical protein